MIDINKPLELADGTPVEFDEVLNGDIWVIVNEYCRLYNRDGTHALGEFPNLRNVQQPELTDPIKAYIDKRIHEELNAQRVATDPDVIAVCEVLAAFGVYCSEHDIHPQFQAALAAYKKHKNA